MAVRFEKQSAGAGDAGAILNFNPSAQTRTNTKGSTARPSLDQIAMAPVTYYAKEETQPKSGLWHSLGAFAQRFMRRTPVAIAGVAFGALLLTTGCASMRPVAAQGAPLSRPSIVSMMPAADTVQRTSLTERSAIVRQHIASMERTIMNGATPAMGMITDNPNITQTVYGNYKQHIIPEYKFYNASGKDQTVEMIFLLPVSGHVGNTLQEQQDNARHYADIDRHRVWIEYGDGSKKILADKIEPNGRLVVPIKLEVTFKPGDNQIVFSPLPEGRPELKCHDHSFPVDPAGFDVGRREIFHVGQ